MDIFPRLEGWRDPWGWISKRLSGSATTNGISLSKPCASATPCSIQANQPQSYHMELIPALFKISNCLCSHVFLFIRIHWNSQYRQRKNPNEIEWYIEDLFSLNLVFSGVLIFSFSFNNVTCTLVMVAETQLWLKWRWSSPRPLKDVLFMGRAQHYAKNFFPVDVPKPTMGGAAQPPWILVSVILVLWWSRLPKNQFFFMVRLKAVVQVYWTKRLSSDSE
jgi:hypothetical protein